MDNKGETKEHRKLKEELKEILGIGKINFDTEVKLNFTGQLDKNERLKDERSIDVAAFMHKKGKRFLIIFECKSGEKIKNINKELNAWEYDINKIKANKANIIQSDENKILNEDLSNLESIKICFVVSEAFEKEKFSENISTLTNRGFHFWDYSAIKYYKKTGNTVGEWIRYEVYREFGINFERTETCEEKAIGIKQGQNEMYVLGMEPNQLLKIGYVSRRASGKPQAYQRILNKDRIIRLSEFIAEKESMLPNSIIIAFDNQQEIQDKISYDSKNCSLTFPKKYCSAWIIDGQHRVFGFLNTKYNNDDESNDEFKLPVVAFKNLDEIFQNRTFVNINYNQKKIDPTLLCDLATTMPDLRNELTWPSLLVAELNKTKPFKDKIKISELDQEWTISNSSFSRYGLLEGLLGYNKKRQSYNGALYNLFPFNPKGLISDSNNALAFKKQSALLKRYFEAVAKNTETADERKDPWKNIKEYSLLKPTGINALLLVLSRIMKQYPEANLDFANYLRPLRKVNFKKGFVSNQGGGWKGFRNFANNILRKLNHNSSAPLQLFGEKEKI